MLYRLSYSGRRAISHRKSRAGPLASSTEAAQTTGVKLDGGTLSIRELAVLGVERDWWQRHASKQAAIRAEVGVAPSTYYRLLHDVLARDEALAFDPMVVRRARRARSTKHRYPDPDRTILSRTKPSH